MLNTSTPIVSVEWLNKNIDNSNLIVIDATLKKVTATKKEEFINESVYIKNARFLDIKNVFSDVSAPFPNTMLAPEIFERKAQELGVNKDSTIIVYDEYGYYSCARVWWMFRAMGHKSIAVLDGGLPSWKEAKFPIQKRPELENEEGDFKADYTSGFIHNHERVLDSIDDENTTILDARSSDRFLGTISEPRKGLRSGHIPNSKSLPFTSILEGTKMKSKEGLIKIFSKFKNERLIFSCGSGITACILALGAEIAGFENKSVYDGSWTEWGSLIELPIEK